MKSKSGHRLVLCLFFSIFLTGTVRSAEYEFVHLRPEQIPRRADLDELEHYLTEQPNILAEIRQRGVVRLVVDERDSTDDAGDRSTLTTRVREILARLNIARDVEIILVKTNLRAVSEEVGVEIAELMRRHEKDPAGAPLEVLGEAPNDLVPEAPRARVKRSFKLGLASLWAATAEKVGRTVDKYIVKSFAKPTREEVLQGLVSKSVPFGISATQFVYALWAANPAAAIAAITLSLALDTFHGAFVTTWCNIQNRLARYRGTTFQSVFNFAYGQFWGVLFRQISYWAGKAPKSAFSLEYLFNTSVSAVLATFIGTKGYQGLNRLYELGYYSRNQRARRQQWVRDVPFMIQGTQLSLGDTWNLWLFWGLWGTSQIIDGYFYLRSITTPQSPMIFISRREILDGEEFTHAFPNAVRTDAIPPVKNVRERVASACSAIVGLRGIE